MQYCAQILHNNGAKIFDVQSVSQNPVLDRFQAPIKWFLDEPSCPWPRDRPVPGRKTVSDPRRPRHTSMHFLRLIDIVDGACVWVVCALIISVQWDLIHFWMYAYWFQQEKRKREGERDTFCSVLLVLKDFYESYANLCDNILLALKSLEILPLLWNTFLLRCAYQGCEKVVVVFSHHAHEQNLQKRNKGGRIRITITNRYYSKATAKTWEDRTRKGFTKLRTQQIRELRPISGWCAARPLTSVPPCYDTVFGLHGVIHLMIQFENSQHILYL